MSLDDVYVFTDHAVPHQHLGPYGIAKIFAIASFAAEVTKLKPYDVAVTTVTGHGHQTGIGAPGAGLSPKQLCDAVRTIPGVKLGVLVLCQCYAGIFNYVDARTPPPLVLIGATNLHLSLSAGLTLVSPIVNTSNQPGLQSWMGNIFMFYFLTWVATPSDVDGDGRVTLMDAYKFAGTNSNAALVAIKRGLYLAIEQASEHLKQLQAVTTTTPAVLGAAEQKLQTLLETLYLHQEPWVLNADQAREVRFW